MKKSLFAILAVVVATTAVNAQPRFGVIAEQGNGLGAFISDDMYNAEVTFGSETGTDEETTTTIQVGANYKLALDSLTALTVGLSYTTVDDEGSADKENTIALQAGFERFLSSNVALTTEINVYESTEIGDEESSAIFSNARVGVAYLF